MEQLNAEWIKYMDAYRLYEPEKPESTYAYFDEEDLPELAKWAKKEGYKRLVIDLT